MHGSTNSLIGQNIAITWRKKVFKQHKTSEDLVKFTNLASKIKLAKTQLSQIRSNNSKN
jgi:hypothetical protein